MVQNYTRERALRFDIITIFPEMFSPILNASMIQRAQAKKKVTIKVHDLRAYTKAKHHKVDDRPFGGGPGMVLTAQPICDAVRKIKGRRNARVILLCPAGRPFTQPHARRLAKLKNLILVCGHYEGVDHRVETKVIDESISIGDYVLTGGELPAMVLVDCVTRLIPGVLGDSDSLTEESFETGLLDYPHYTRPANFHGQKVPSVLLSGNHNAVQKWRHKQAMIRTRKRRPDLLQGQGR
jgi:tRNA (guanine37-N1)-methyltransferase